MIESNIKEIFSCDTDKLWNVITDNSNFNWRSDVSKIEIIDENNFVEYDKKGYTTYFTITSKKKNVEYKFNIKNNNLSGKWIGYFKQQADGKIELDFTEEIKVNNFLMRIFAKSFLKKQQNKYMEDLKKEIYK